MKYVIRMFLFLCLLLWLTSCALRPKASTLSQADTQPVVKVDIDAPRRRFTMPDEKEVSEKEKASRRRPLILSDIEEPPEIEKKKETQKPAIESVIKKESVSVFEPFDPDRALKEAMAPGEEGLPQEIRAELLGLSPEEDYVTLNFEQAPVAQILNAVSETLGINFIMSPGAKGAITMQTSKPVPASELFQILQSVLEVNGLTLVPSGRYYKLVAGKEAKQYPIRVLSGKEGEELPSEDSFITQIIPLDYIPVKDMQNILQPFLSKSAPPMIHHEELNIIIINDLASNMKRLLKFVKELDKPLYQPKEKVYVYYVENTDAEKLAGTLNSIYKEQDKSRKFPFGPAGEEAPEQPQQPQPQQVIQTPFGPYVPAEQVSGEVRITADKEINALIIVTSPRNYPTVLETIKKLDIMPKQALIEVLVVDVSLTDETSFGLGWYLKGHEQNLGARFDGFEKIPPISQETFQNVFGYSLITESGHFMAFMRQFSKVNTLNVVSSPYIMALDNQKATINITQQYPIERINYVTSGTAVIPEITYDYKEVGLKLDVTPKINESNMVTLELNQEVSEFARTDEITGQGIYVKRVATSKVVVKDGQTIVIGGLIQNKRDKTKSGIPFFSDIPVIGKLFGSTGNTISKTELLLFMTPHVVSSQLDAQELTSEFEGKVESLKKILEDRKAEETKKKL